MKRIDFELEKQIQKLSYISYDFPSKSFETKMYIFIDGFVNERFIDHTLTKNLTGSNDGMIKTGCRIICQLLTLQTNNIKFAEIHLA